MQRALTLFFFRNQTESIEQHILRRVRQCTPVRHSEPVFFKLIEVSFRDAHTNCHVMLAPVSDQFYRQPLNIVSKLNCTVTNVSLAPQSRISSFFLQVPSDRNQCL